MTNPKIKPCPRCQSADHMCVYAYESGWRHVECDKCYYLGPGCGSTIAAIKAHNATLPSTERLSEHNKFNPETEYPGSYGEDK